MTVLTLAPMASFAGDDAMLVPQESFGEQPRLRKFSEGYREVGSVDAVDDLPVISSPERANSLLFKNGDKRIAEETTTQEQLEDNRNEDDLSPEFLIASSSSSIDVIPMSSDHARISNIVDREQDEREFLNQLPVAMASLDDSVGSCPTIPTATSVVRVMTAQCPSNRGASLISVKIYKPSVATKLGIRLSLNNDGHLQLAHISGLMKDSPLRAGDVLLRINGENVSAWTTTKALQFLMETWGWVNLTVRNPNSHDASLVLASVRKCTLADKLGISFCTPANKLTIDRLNVAGLLGGRSAIRVGDVVESINSIPCTQVDNTIAVNTIRSLPDWVHVLVRKPTLHEHDGDQVFVYVAENGNPPESLTFNELEDNQNTSLTVAEAINTVEFEDVDDLEEPAFISVTLTKRSQSEQLGISLVSADSIIYIKAVGKLSESHLKEGMMLLAINHRPTSKMSLKDTTRYIRNHVGPITLLVRNPHGNPKYIRSVAYKTAAQEQNLIGVSFRGSSGRQLRICEIRENGLFIDSLLNVGDSVMQINDVPCSKWRPKDAVDLVRVSERMVSLLVKTKSKTGAVIGKLSSGRSLLIV